MNPHPTMQNSSVNVNFAGKDTAGKVVGVDHRNYPVVELPDGRHIGMHPKRVESAKLGSIFLFGSKEMTFEWREYKLAAAPQPEPPKAPVPAPEDAKIHDDDCNCAECKTMMRVPALALCR